MTVGSLFAGIGGFDLAARWMGWETKWVSEIDPYASAVLKKHWPDAPNLGDITKITQPPSVDLLCGGFPCQDISLAGKGEGIGGARSGLWKHYARLIEETRPKYVVAENVAVLRSRGLGVVLRDLMALGYDAEWHCIPAAYVGAPHRRDRIWIVAYPHGSGSYARPFSGVHHGEEGARAWDGESQRLRSALPPRSLANTNGAGLEERVVLSGGVHGEAGPPSREITTQGSESDVTHEGRPLHDPVCERHGPQSSEVCPGWDGPINSGWWAVEPNVGRVAHGVPSRVDRLRCLGNAIVPRVAYTIFQAIERHERAS